MFKKEKPKPEKKSEKAKEIMEEIRKLEIGEVIRPTPLAERIKIDPNDKKKHMHVNTLIDTLDLYDSLKDVGFRTIRDKGRRIREILRTDEDLAIRTGLRELKQEIISLKSIIDELKTSLRKK